MDVIRVHGEEGFPWHEAGTGQFRCSVRLIMVEGVSVSWERKTGIRRPSTQNTLTITCYHRRKDAVAGN